MLKGLHVDIDQLRTAFVKSPEMTKRSKPCSPDNKEQQVIISEVVISVNVKYYAQRLRKDQNLN